MKDKYVSEDLGCWTLNIKIMRNGGGVGTTAIVYSCDNWEGDIFDGIAETKSGVIELVRERLVNLDFSKQIEEEVRKFLNDNHSYMPV